MTERQRQFRNVAIISHVDHGKTTLLDGLLWQSGTFRENEEVEDRVMDSLDLEKERGITIIAKNTSVSWNGVKINFVDTPGHADFGGEVERTLSLVDGALVLVDVAEGPLPQTRFVLRKALAAGLHLIVVLNKIDRSDARIEAVHSALFELLIDLGATEEQIDSPVVYTSARLRTATLDPAVEGKDMAPLLDLIEAEIPAPRGDPDGPLQILVTTLGYDDYVGPLAIGRVHSGRVGRATPVVVMGDGGAVRPGTVSRLYVYESLDRVEVEEAPFGEIVCLAGLDGVRIGDTVADPEDSRALPRVEVEEPTVSLTIRANTSPLSGRDGKYLTGGHIADRLGKEALRNASLRIREAPGGEGRIVAGRGELQLAVLVETMRREGYEMEVSRPEVIFREVDGVLQEPYEDVIIDVPSTFIGAVTEKISERRGQVRNLEVGPDGRARIDIKIPSQGLLGFRSPFLIITRGQGLLHGIFSGYEKAGDPVPGRIGGALVADRPGKATAYALWNLQERGTLFITPGTLVYPGMVIGESSREQDIPCNPTREKHMTNVRAASADEEIRLTRTRTLSLDQALLWINGTEMVEVTPKTFRIRKRIRPASRGT